MDLLGFFDLVIASVVGSVCWLEVPQGVKGVGRRVTWKAFERRWKASSDGHPCPWPLSTDTSQDAAPPVAAAVDVAPPDPYR